ncbi:MAG: aldo/keto reductase [Treponemataceae bacterium]|nr:aldo/keto reductase [Treponemataceae bacterium]
MNYRHFPKIDDCKISALGFGCMRFPLVQGTNEVDKEKTRQLIKAAFKEGVNYYDTAWPYHGGKSEEIIGSIFEEEKLRDSIYIADKCPVWEIKQEADFDRILDEQLRRLRTDHIDFYLLHAMGASRWEEMKKLNALSFLERAKKAGKIRHIGFSFHDSLEVFKKMIDEYQGWEFCQIQYNYLDDDGEKQTSNPGKQALEYAAKREIGVIAMEPLRGGMLANPPVGVRNIFAAAETPRLPAEWGLRFVLESQEIVTALSGMNDMTQVLVNCATASSAFPNSLPQKQLAVVKKAKEWFESRVRVPCTHCNYCMPCPQGVSIPDVFSEYNKASMNGAFEDGVTKVVSSGYLKLLNNGKGADKCVKCGLCAANCPQHIDIPSVLEEAGEKLA